MRALTVTAVLLLAACSRPPQPPPKPPPPPVERAVWSALSKDAHAEIRQFDLEAGGCRLEGVLNNTVAWKADGCLSGPNQLRFASPDAERLMTIDVLPQIENGAWAGAPVLTLYERGTLVRKVTLTELIKDQEKLRKTQRYVRWVQGTNDVAGIPPALTADGLAVHVEAIDGIKYDVRFDQGDGPVLALARPEAAMSARMLYEYGSAESPQYAETLNDVPKKFRAAARKVEMKSVGKAQH